MAKIVRKNQKIFGASSSVNQIGVFGSFAAGAIAYSTDVETIQSLSQWDQGWFSAVVGNNSPAIEDVNAADYVWGYQLAYLFQSGIPEWNTSTVYYIGSFTTDGLGNIFYSLTDTNTGNALTSTSNWYKISGPPAVQSPAGDYTIVPGDTLVRMTGTHTATVPDVAGLKRPFTIKNIGAGTISIAFTGGQLADGQGSLSLPEQYGFFTLFPNGTGFDITAWG